ncbi:MAG: tripartite tricarboxylate transporter substrate-binding protein, partial [Burkholderiales bacterium]
MAQTLLARRAATRNAVRSAISLLAAAALTLPLSAAAQSWPTKPIRLLVGFAPGGGTDVMARLLAQKMTESTGQSFIVENRPGAGSNIGTDYVAK